MELFISPTLYPAGTTHSYNLYNLHCINMNVLIAKLNGIRNSILPKLFQMESQLETYCKRLIIGDVMIAISLLRHV